MTTEDFISELFWRVDEAMTDMPKHPLASLWPSEIVTLGILFAFKESGTHAFYRWLSRDWRPLFPTLPERTRFFRLLATHPTCGSPRGAARRTSGRISTKTTYGYEFRGRQLTQRVFTRREIVLDS